MVRIVVVIVGESVDVVTVVSEVSIDVDASSVVGSAFVVVIVLVALLYIKIRV